MSAEFDPNIFSDSDKLLDSIEDKNNAKVKSEEISIMVCRFSDAVEIEQGYQKKRLLELNHRFWMIIDSLVEKLC